MATTALTLDGFPFVGATPESGRAKVLDLEGWITRSVRRSRWENTARPGTSSGPGVAAEKHIDFTALIFYPDPAAAARERKVVAALGGNGSVPMRVTDADGALQRLVTIDDINPIPATSQWLRVEASVTADDPNATSLVPETFAVPAGGTVNVETPGTAAAELVVTLTTAGTVDLTAGGLRLTTATLPAGSIIDVASASITGPTGANLAPGNVIRYGFPAIPPGGGPIKQAGTAALSAQFFHTYA